MSSNHPGDNLPPDIKIDERLRLLYDRLQQRATRAAIIRRDVVALKFPNDDIDMDIGKFLYLKGRFTGYLPDTVRAMRVMIPDWDLDQVKPVRDMFYVVFQHRDGRVETGKKVAKNPALAATALMLQIYVSQAEEFLADIRSVSDKYSAAIKALRDSHDDLIRVEQKWSNFPVDGCDLV